MLRPATPLSLILVVAFGLLVLSVLSTPVIKGVPLGTFNDFDYGVFGFCHVDDCSGFQVGYKVSTDTTKESDFNLPSNTRNNLTTLLIVHPIACLLTLVTMVMAFTSHIRSAAHSSRYLLAVTIMNFLSFLVSLLAFLADVLVFIPHLGWGSYVVLGATILLGLGSIMACAMRRTLVSRKSRKKKIAEHAEMSGENFYNRENAIKAANAAVAPVPSIPAIPAVPSVNKSTSDGHTAFATFESSKEKANSQVSEERIPLTSQNSIHRMNSADQNNDMPLPPPPVNMGGYGGPPRSNSAPPQADQYGNPIDNGQSMYAGNYNASVDRFNNYPGRGGPQNFRGRGGYGRGGSRGGYNGPNNYPNNGNGYGGPRRGDGSSYGPRGGYGPGPRGPGRSRQPPANYQNDNGYNNYQDTYNMPRNNMNMNQGGYNDGYVDTYNNNMIPNNDGYNNIGNNSNNGNDPNSYVPYSQQQLVIDSYTSDNAQNPTNPMREFNFETENNPDASDLNLPRAESPPPLPADLAATAPPASGSPAPVAFEMEGSPTEPKASLKSESPQEAKVDVELDGAPQPPRLGDGPRQTFVSAASKYSQDGPDGPDNGSVPPSPNNGWGNTARPSALPSPLALGREPSPSKISENGPPGHGAYYEDVDPRYDNPPISPMPVAPPSHEIMITPPEVTIDDIPGKSDPRSPGCESDVSNFTSISQRGINPRWNPNAPPMPPFGGGGPMGGPRGPGHGPGPRPRPRQNLGPGPGQGGPWVGGGGGSRRPPPAQQRQDMLLNSNPDFALPGRR
ncbi:pH-response regulator protein palI/RIM9 [Ceratocystis fimbriata CBS 114723]|uniref:pH-response regulator protein palI/RIM9 n=1 Tax=Ceratocystis fimbriata CBS 114723 TaxID=1035309 RepID=A0A2C5WZX1_9PEZI|nr:pH-response regulator protein palI/RIM9 [Ceratocystis fimbriata CBS 114723]